METRVLDKKGDERLVRLYVIIGFYRLWIPTIQMETRVLDIQMETRVLDVQMETRVLDKKNELWRKDPSE